MELYEKLLEEEIFVDQLRMRGALPLEGIIGKKCLIVCAIGGIDLLRKLYANALGELLVQMGAEKCDQFLLFNPGDMNSYCDLTDMESAVGTLTYDFIFVLGGLEKTHRIAEGVRQLQAVCPAGGRILVVARTPKDLSARRLIDAYEDVWRYEVEDLELLFAGSALEATATDSSGEIIAAVFIRGEVAAASACDSLFHVRSGRRINPNGAVPQGYFAGVAELDALGIK